MEYFNVKDLKILLFTQLTIRKNIFLFSWKNMTCDYIHLSIFDLEINPFFLGHPKVKFEHI